MKAWVYGLKFGVFSIKTKIIPLSVSAEGISSLAGLSIENLHSKTQTSEKTHLCPQKDWCHICANRGWNARLAGLALALLWWCVTFAESPKGFGLQVLSLEKCWYSGLHSQCYLYLREPSAWISCYLLLNLKQMKLF